MSRHVLGALVAAGVVLLSWMAVSQTRSSSSPESMDSANLLTPALRTGITPVPEGAPGHYVLRHRQASALFTERGVELRLPSRTAEARELGWSVAGGRASRPQAEKPREAKLDRWVEAKKEWERDVPTYGGLRYPGVLPGVDLWFEERSDGLEYGFRAERGGDLRRVELEYAGAREVRVVDEGLALEVDLGEGVLREEGLRCWQEAAAGVERPVGCRYVQARRGAGERWAYSIEVDVEDPHSPVVVDPVILWTTYLNVDAADDFADMVRSPTGELFVTGTLPGSTYVEVGTLQGVPGKSSLFVARLNPDGGVGKMTYLGGESEERAHAIALGNNKVYVAGYTTSASFGTTLIPTNTGAAGKDGLIVQLDPVTLKAEWAYLLGPRASPEGTPGDEIIHDLAVGTDGGIFVVGSTNSLQFPMAPDATTPRGLDAFISRLTPVSDGGIAEVNWSLVLRGSNDDVAYAVDLGSGGRVNVTGSTKSLDMLPSTNRKRLHAGPDGTADIFIARLNDLDAGIEASTHLGGQGDDEGRAIIVWDSDELLLVGGTTRSQSLEISAPSSTTSQAFVAALAKGPLSTDTVNHSLLGGNAEEEGRTIALSGDSIYLGGRTSSRDFPLVGAFDSSFGGGTYKGFVARVRLGGTVPEWSSLVGGVENDEVLALLSETSGHVLIGGNTQRGGDTDMFVMRVDPDGGTGTGTGDGGTAGDGGTTSDGGTEPDGGQDGGTGGTKPLLGWSLGCAASDGPGAFALGALVGLALLSARRRKVSRG